MSLGHGKVVVDAHSEDQLWARSLRQPDRVAALEGHDLVAVNSGVVDVRVARAGVLEAVLVVFVTDNAALADAGSRKIEAHVALNAAAHH